MDTKNKILFFSGLFASVGLAYIVLRKPKLTFINIDWLNKKGTYRFGNTIKEFSSEMGDLVNNAYVLKDQYNLNGNSFYLNKRFLNVTNSLDKKKTFFNVVDSNGKSVEKITIDWLSKIKY